MCASKIVDIPSPKVPPEADEVAVEELAEEILEQVPERTTHAMVMGEFTLIFMVIAGLQKRGVVCMAATTEREVVQKEDGSKHSFFRFIRFRQYSQDEMY